VDQCLVVLWRTAAAACATAANEPANAAHIMRLQPPVLAAPNHFGSLVIYKHVKQRLSATVRSPGTAGLRSFKPSGCRGRQRAGTRSGGCASVRASACERCTAQRCTALRYGGSAGACVAARGPLPLDRPAGLGLWAYLSLNREPPHSLTGHCESG
jgi:hypothetical protein